MQVRARPTTRFALLRWRAVGGLERRLVILAIMLWVSSVKIALAMPPMAFHLEAIGHRQETVVVADGTIDNGTATRLQAFLSANPGLAHSPTVLLSSPGGAVLGATTLGRYLRRIHATSVVGTVRDFGEAYGPGIAPAVCVGSCVYAFLGGSRRILPQRSVIGVKHMRYEGSGETASVYGQVVSSLRAYVRSVGVAPGFADFCEQQPFEVLHVLTPAEIAEWHIAAAQ